MSTPIPLLIFGDGPRLHSGLGRIARDLAMNLVARQERLGIHVAQVGVDYTNGWQWQPWDFYGFQPDKYDQGRAAMFTAVEDMTAEYGCRPIVLMVTDPSRCFDLVRQEKKAEANIDAEWWGYFPIDAHNAQERIGGPAQETLQACTRLIAYGRYGAGVIRRSTNLQMPVSYLPHGIDTTAFHPGIPLDEAHKDFQEWAEGHAGSIKIGAVATNQPRKDLGLLFASVAEIKAKGYPVALWLHTDILTHAWDIGELAASFNFSKAEVAVSTNKLFDAQLAAQYGWSDVTLAPGLGEGFGYPIVESLACGTPTVHGRYAGGVDLIPRAEWLVEPVAWRLESCYAVQRPVMQPAAVAAALLRAMDWKRREPAICAAYCSGAVAHLDWRHLWPRWESWIKAGLTAYRNNREEVPGGQQRAE
jgi:glycosyltransferase involved in cell wall biosynthesis